MTRRHAKDTATFEELNFMGQNRAINVRVAVLKKSITAHLRRAAQESRDVDAIRAKRAAQLRRLADQVAS